MAVKIAKQYDKFADNFAKFSAKNNKVSIESFKDQFDFSLKNKKILDLGCGDGTNLVVYKKMGAIIYGIDASKEMIKMAKVKLPSADLRVAFFNKTTFGKNNFDVVVSKYAMQTDPDIEPIYREVVRVLKKNGIFIFLVVHPFRQFIEKKKTGKDYFKKEVVKSVFLGGMVSALEPTHTLGEYLSDYFLNNFEIISFVEKFDPAAEKIGADKYPGFMIIKAKKK